MVPLLQLRQRRARKRAKQSKSAAAKKEWNAARVNWEKVVKDAKRRCWDAFVERVFDTGKNTINWHRFNAAVNPKEADVGPIAADNQGMPASLTESLNRIAKHYESVSEEPRLKPQDEEILKYVHTIHDKEADPVELDDEFTLQQLEKVCSHLLNNKAPGPDGISNLLIKNMPAEFRRVLLFAYNFSWEHGELPASWKCAHVCPIYKGHPNPRNIAKSYRPISLTSCLVKVFERMILDRLVEFLDSPDRRFFSASQSGFRSQHSTIDQIYRIINRVNECFANHNYVSVAFLDIVAAFDTVWHEGLLFKLHKAGVTGRAWRWIKCFLTGRKSRVVHRGSQSDWFNIGAGVPQGSILGPFLFLVFINDVPSMFGVVVVLFADDMAIWPTIDGPPGDKRLQDALDRISIWGERWHIVFSPTKSVTMCFSRMRCRPQPTQFYLDNDALPDVDKFRYLGVILKPDLTSDAHTEKVITSATTAAFKIARIVTKTGPPPRIIRQLVQALVVPIISYAWPLWCPPTEWHWNKLESAICLPLRCALGLHRSVQKLALLAEFGLVRPSIWRDCCALVFAHRVDVKLLKDRPDHPIVKIFREEARSRLRKNCPKYLIPFGKAIKAAEHRLGVSHVSEKASRIASLRKLALTRQICQLRTPDQHHKCSSYSSDFALCPAPTSYIKSDSKTTAVLRARIRLNRHHLRSRQAKLRLIDSAQCPACLWYHRPAPVVPTETPRHVLLDCPRFTTARMQCSIELNLFNVDMTLDVLTGDVHDVPAKARPDVLSATAAFLHKINTVLLI